MLAALKSNLKSTFPGKAPALETQFTTKFPVWFTVKFPILQPLFQQLLPKPVMLFHSYDGHGVFPMCHFWEFGILSFFIWALKAPKYLNVHPQEGWPALLSGNWDQTGWKSFSPGLWDPLGLALLINSALSHKVWQCKLTVLLQN